MDENTEGADAGGDREDNDRTWPGDYRLPDQVKIYQKQRNIFRPGHQTAEEKKRLFGPIVIDGR